MCDMNFVFTYIMSIQMFRFIRSNFNTDNVSSILKTFVYLDFLNAYRACFRNIDIDNDPYCSKDLLSVEQEHARGEKLINVSHIKDGEDLQVCWIQVIQKSDDPIPPLELNMNCCIWPPSL